MGACVHCCENCSGLYFYSTELLMMKLILAVVALAAVAADPYNGPYDDGIHTGTVKMYMADIGKYGKVTGGAGFIADDAGGDVFLEIFSVGLQYLYGICGAKVIEVGQRVQYNVVRGHNGPKTANVEVIPVTPVTQSCAGEYAGHCMSFKHGEFYSCKQYD